MYFDFVLLVMKCVAYLVATSALVPPAVLGQGTYFPPYLQRVGFSVVFGGAAYVLAAGDHRNGSGIATGMSIQFLPPSLVR